jgi:hypothetical protein
MFDDVSFLRRPERPRPGGLERATDPQEVLRIWMRTGVIEGPAPRALLRPLDSISRGEIAGLVAIGAALGFALGYFLGFAQGHP